MMFRIKDMKERHIVFWLALMLILWALLAWYIARSNFTHEYETLVEKEQIHAKNLSLDIADSVDRNLHFVAGVSGTFRNGLRILNGVWKFGPDAQPSRLPRKILEKRWTNDETLKDLNTQLELIQNSLGIDLIYVVNAAGDCIAASNWKGPTSPIGINFADRQWFADARNGKNGIQYAMGKTTHIPGLYFASPIVMEGRFNGAVISKVDITSLSFLTRQSDAFVTDSNGVIILAHDPPMLMMAVPGASVYKMSTQERLSLYQKTDFPELKITTWEGLSDDRLKRIGNESYPHVQSSTEIPEFGLKIYAEGDLQNLPLLKRQWRSNFLLMWLLGSATILGLSSLYFYFRSIRQSKAAVETSEQQLRLLLGSVSNGIWGLDKDGQTTFINRAAADMLGYTPEELGDKPMHATIHHSYPDGTPYPENRCPMHATLVDGKSRTGVDEVLWRKDGSNFPVDYSSHPIFRQGKLDGAVVVFEDVSERKQT